jgi:ATP diphosphatase
VSAPLNELLDIMRRLRAEGGCPWDRAQTFATIAPFTIEEAYEVADAIERGSMPALKDELGDLLFQVVFHAQMAEELQQFNFDEVAAGICDKLKRRHPHVFAGAAHAGAAHAEAAGAAAVAVTVEQQSALWEDIKAQERAAARAIAAPSVAASHLDGVPSALPALKRAHKLSKRAARVGFDWHHSEQTADKVAEELAEVRAAARNQRDGASVSPEVFEEVGDLLFAAANLARKLEVDAEAALRAANAKFERRFRGMETLAAERGESFAHLDLAAQERLWQAVKQDE